MENTDSIQQTDSALPEAIALVNGQAYLGMPKDLYIPPDAMEVFLEAFEGPLDLLLYLIK
jgi:segregation and condensation protein A